MPNTVSHSIGLSSRFSPGQRLSTNPVLDGAAAPRVRIRIDLEKSAPIDRKVLPVKVGNTQLEFPYYVTTWTNRKTRRKYQSFTLVWSDRGKRQRVKRSSMKLLRARAGEIAINIVNGQTAMSEFGQDDRASFKRARELIRPTGLALEVAAGIIAQCVEILGVVSPVEAARYYRLQHPAGVIAKDIPAIVDELLGKRAMGSKWRRNLKKMFDRISSHFTGALPQYTTRDFDDWLDGLKDADGKKLGLRSRRNHRDALSNLVNFAKARGYVSSDWCQASETEDPDPPAVDVNLYTPDELVRLLNKAESHRPKRGSHKGKLVYADMIPFIVVTAFSGVRHGEMNEEKVRLLDWSDFDWEMKQLYVDKHAAKRTSRKKGDDRTVDLPENLIAWLKPYVKQSGRICDRRNTANALCRLQKLAGVSGSKRNALRKSFISYKNALTRNIDLVADQAGNSSAVIRSNYKRSGTKMRRLAERWFSVMPCRADVLPLWQLASRAT